MPDNPTVPAKSNRKVGRPRKGEEKIDLLECWRLRVKHRLSYREIAERFDCSETSVLRACQRLAELVPDPNAAASYREHRADVLDAVELELLRSLMQPDKLTKATVNQAAFAFRQIADHGRLARGMTTENLGLLGKIVVENAKELFKEEKQPALTNTPSTERKD